MQTTDDRKYRYIFGPIASRRLGSSLGVDIIPFKTCTYDCIYCQLGLTKNVTAKKGPYVETSDVIDELKSKLNEGVKIDYITFSGSGEPTLNINIGEIIASIKKITKIPVAVITNSSLLSDKKVRDSLKDADLVIPSLDAGTEQVFKKINRNHPNIKFNEMVQGLIDFRTEFKKEIALEVFFVEGINTSSKEIEAMKEIIEKINPDRIEINTVARPPADGSSNAVSEEKLNEIKVMFGQKSQIIGKRPRNNSKGDKTSKLADVIAMLRRRPCTLKDVINGLNADCEDVNKCVDYLKASGAIKEKKQNGEIYYYWEQ